MKYTQEDTYKALTRASFYELLNNEEFEMLDNNMYATDEDFAAFLQSIIGRKQSLLQYISANFQQAMHTHT